MVPRWLDLLWIDSDWGLADLEDAIGRRETRADHAGGGYHPIVSPDGQQVFYTKEPPAEGIWKFPAEGGQEVQITDQGRGMGFDVADDGIFFMNWSANPAAVEMFDFASRQFVTVARLPLRSEAIANLAVSRDGRSVLYVACESQQSDIEMLREFR